MLDRLINRLFGDRKRASTAARHIAERYIASGNRAEDEHRLADALDCYRAAVAAAPQYAPAHLNLGIGLEAIGNGEGALQCYERAIALEPANPFVNYNLGKLLYSRRELKRAEQLLRRALEHKPAFPEANVLLSHLYEAQNNLPAAAVELETALKHHPQYVGALLNYSMILGKLNRWSDAEAALRRAAAAGPNDVEVLQSLAQLLLRQGRANEAAECYEKAIAKKPGVAQFHWHLGNILADNGRLDAAVLHYQQALSLEPDFVEVKHSLCMVSYEQGRPAEAIACLREVALGHSNFAPAYLSLGNILRSERKLDEAFDALQQALAIDPQLLDAHLTLGKIYIFRGDIEGATRSYRNALSIDPECVSARWSIAMLQGVVEPIAVDGRRVISQQIDELDRWIGETRLAASESAVGEQTLLYLAYQEESNREVLSHYGTLCSRIMAEWFKGQHIGISVHPRSHDILRVGVVSAHFHNHSVWNAIVKGWFQQMDRARFSLEAFYLGTESDQETQLAQSLAAHFEGRHGNLRRWAQVISNRHLDVLIYPEIGMDAMTVKLASLRLAPVQLTTWGHPDTSGLPTIDYFVSAEGMEPEEADENYTEQLILLPHLGSCFPSRQIVPIPPDLKALGIDARAPILICPGTPFKYVAQHDRVLVEIAKRVGDCIFVFFSYHVERVSQELHDRLRALFRREKLDPDKAIRFVPWQTPAQFHGLMNRAHVLLDTIGFSGFNTAMQAVESSLPIITREGKFLRGRLASGILKRMRLHEMVADTENEYIDLAAKICRDAQYRACLREEIEARRDVLFDDTAPVRAFEDFLARVRMPR